jgi:flavodoxin
MREENIAIVVASRHHGNTRKVAQAIARAVSADLFGAEVVLPRELADYSMIGLGSGIYFGAPDRSVRALAKLLPSAANASMNKRAFLFSTSGLPCLGWLWHRGLRRTLSKKGYAIIGEFNCRGWDTVGPLWLFGGLNRKHPNDNDLDRATAFGRSLLHGETAKEF